MGAETLVGAQLEEGWKLIQELLTQGFDIRAALWLKRSPDASWYLYIVSPRADVEDSKPQRQVHEVMDKMPQPFWLDPSDIQLIGLKHPVAKAILELHKKYPNMKASRRPGGKLGNDYIEDAYIYPAMIPMEENKK